MADTKIQTLLLPKGSNLDTFREEKACCKKIVRDTTFGLDAEGSRRPDGV